MAASNGKHENADHTSAACYGQRNYWEDRYFRELRMGTSQYEWYLGYAALRTILRWHVPLQAAVLQVGVGTSSLQLEMALDGYEHIHNVDYSQVLIEHMLREHEGLHQLSYELADCRHMPQVASESFDAVIDKGTLDAILCGTTSFNHVPNTLLECARVLRPGGVFLMITYGPPERRLEPLTSITLPWDVAIYALRKADADGEVVKRAANSPAGPLALGPFAQHQVYVPPHPLVAHLLAILRARETPTAAFRSAMAELGRILIYEASRDWLPTFETQVETPLALADAVVVDVRRPVKVVPILRAGLIPLEQASTVLPAMQTYHVGLVRDEKTLQPTEYLNKLPKTLDPEDRVLVSDPMVATGGTMLKVLEDLVARGANPSLIRVISITVAPPALKLLSEKFPGLKIYTACIDPELNDKGYIVPGLGDAGDRAFGTASSDQFGNITE